MGGGGQGGLGRASEKVPRSVLDFVLGGICWVFVRGYLLDLGRAFIFPGMCWEVFIEFVLGVVRWVFVRGYLFSLERASEDVRKAVL